MPAKKHYPWPAPKKAPQAKPKYLPPATKPSGAGKPSPYPSKASGLGPQSYGGPVVGRLQPHLPTPQWLNRIADESDARLEQHRNNPEESRKRAFSPALPIPGLPPPPASSLGSRQQMQAHFRSFSPEHRRTANFFPGDKSVVIKGRPVQLIMITHEGAQYGEREPYIPWLFRPLVPQCLLGYTFDGPNSPGEPRHFCVINWFQALIFLAMGNKKGRTLKYDGSDQIGEPVASDV